MRTHRPLLTVLKCVSKMLHDEFGDCSQFHAILHIFEYLFCFLWSFVHSNSASNKYVLPKTVRIKNATGFHHLYEYDSLVQSLQVVFVYVILLIRKVGCDRPAEE